MHLIENDDKIQKFAVRPLPDEHIGYAQYIEVLGSVVGLPPQAILNNHAKTQGRISAATSTAKRIASLPLGKK